MSPVGQYHSILCMSREEPSWGRSDPSLTHPNVDLSIPFYTYLIILLNRFYYMVVKYGEQLTQYQLMLRKNNAFGNMSCEKLHIKFLKYVLGVHIERPQMLLL